jgi:hypothetical protein
MRPCSICSKLLDISQIIYVNTNLGFLLCSKQHQHLCVRGRRRLKRRICRSRREREDPVVVVLVFAVGNGVLHDARVAAFDVDRPLARRVLARRGGKCVVLGVHAAEKMARAMLKFKDLFVR